MSTASLARSFFVILALLTPILPGEAAEQTATPLKTAPASPPTAAIPLAEVATRAAEVLNLLPTLTAQLVPSAAIQGIVTQLPEITERIDVDLAGTAQILRGQPALATIAAHQVVWKERQLQTTRWLNLLTQRATQLQDTLNLLAVLQETWRETRGAAKIANAPEAIFQQIDAVLAAIGSAEMPFQAQRSTVLGLQSQVAQEVARCGEALVLFAQAERTAVSGILARDSQPIWSAEQWAQARTALPARIREVNRSLRDELVQYAQDFFKGRPLHGGGFVVLIVLACMVRRRVRQWTAAGEDVSPATRVFDRPFAAAVLVPLSYLSSVVAALPSMLRQVFEVLILLPAIRLTRPAVDPRVVIWLYTLALLFTFDSIRQAYVGFLGLEQAMLALEMLAGMAVLGHSLTLGDLRRTSAHTWVAERLRALRVGAGLVLVILVVGLVAGVLGYMRLARLLASIVLGSGALALMLYASVRVVSGVVAFALRVWPLRLLQMVQHHRDLLERRAHTVLRWTAIGVWTIRMLNYVGLFQSALSFGTAVLGARLQRGSMSISLGDVLDFVLTVWVAYLVSAFIRFTLEEDVYPRIRLPRGISYAFSSLLNYVIVAFGFVLGLGVLGMDLSKVTILASAFGVGIGFGLQSVVNNFVSGLILLFERPIHVGDAIEAGDILGNVRRIGIRASVVRTWQGAEIIVPNAQFITERVTNWTLSDRQRCIDLPVGVNYSAPPRKVIEMLEAVARAHPQVLQFPAPKAYFTGFGDSSINFELRAWTDQFDQWFQIRSELAMAVYDAGHAAGMSFPFPQREVRLLRDASAESAAPSPQPGAATEEAGGAGRPGTDAR
jgi:potassium-dependent mechanosensitive channel